MATTRARKQADGSTRYTAFVRIWRGKNIVYQESKTFALRTAATSWAKHREVTLEQPGALTRVNHGAPTLAELMTIRTRTAFNVVSRAPTHSAKARVKASSAKGNRAIVSMTFASFDQGRWRSSGALRNFIWAFVRIPAALWFRESVARDAVMVVGDPDR